MPLGNSPSYHLCRCHEEHPPFSCSYLTSHIASALSASSGIEDLKGLQAFLTGESGVGMLNLEGHLDFSGQKPREPSLVRKGRP